MFTDPCAIALQTDKQLMAIHYTKAQLIDALVAEWEYLCHDDYDPEDQTPEEYRTELQDYTMEELIEESQTDENYTLEEYMKNYG